MNSEQENRNTALETPPPQASRRGRPAHHYWAAIVAALVVVLLIVSGILPRIQARANLRKETQELAATTVSVVQPKPAGAAPEIVLPANVQAFIDAPIYARTNGYLKRWYADIGAHVKSGQLLAEIDTPEVNQALRQTRADLNTAEANLNLSRITAERYQDLLKTDSVSKQDADNAAGDYAAKQAIVHSAEANVKRLEELQSFQKIYAPFDGVITARNTDIGALIDSGASGGQRTELFHIAQPDKLRVYVNVPEAYSQAARPGLTADLILAEFPGRRFQGKLVRTANAIDMNTRTLLVEIDVDNPTGTLLTGAYAEVHLKFPGANSSLIVPVNSLLFRSEGLRIGVVPDGKHAELRPVTLGHDFGNEVEVVSGLNPDDVVIVNPPDSLASGQNLRVAQTSSQQTPSQGAAK
jgi:RND family efflux transporter MFP subunit